MDQRKPPKTAIAVDSNILATYVGRYELNPNFILTITEQQGKLYVQATGQEKFELFAATETEFFLTVVEAEITFLKNSTDQVDRLILNQNGRKLPALKITLFIDSRKRITETTQIRLLFHQVLNQSSAFQRLSSESH